MTSTTLHRPTTRPPGPPPRGRSRRRPARRRIGLRLVLIAVLVAALVAGVVWLVGYSPVLAARTVAVSGNQTLSTSDVQAAADVPLGTPLARQDLAAIAQRVANLPSVERSHVVRRWPGTVSVSVVERTPVVAIRRAGGYVLVDRYGVAYANAKSRPRGVALTQVEPGNTDLLVEVGTVAESLPAALAAQVNTIQAGTQDSITLRLDHDVSVSWGNADESALKAEVVLALLKQKPHHIDVSAPHSPSTR